MPSTKLTQSTLEYLVPFTPLVFSINGGMGRDCLILSGRRLLSYRNQFIDLLRKSMDGFLYDSGLRLERVKVLPAFSATVIWKDTPSAVDFK